MGDAPTLWPSYRLNFNVAVLRKGAGITRRAARPQGDGPYLGPFFFVGPGRLRHFEEIILKQRRVTMHYHLTPPCHRAPAPGRLMCFRGAVPPSLRLRLARPSP